MLSKLSKIQLLNLTLTWLNTVRTTFFFLSLPEVLCERGILAESWWPSVPLHWRRRAHLWVWCSGRYSMDNRMQHSRLIKWIKCRKRLSEQRNCLTCFHRFGKWKKMSEASCCVLVRWHLFPSLFYTFTLYFLLYCSVCIKYPIYHSRPHIYFLFPSFQFCFELCVLCKISSLKYKVYVKENQIIYLPR